VCVIFRRITRQGRVGTLASIYGGWEGRPARLYIRSDRVEYLALLCPVHISALPPLCLFHPPFRRPSLATAARCSFLRLRFVCFCLGSKLRLEPRVEIECFAKQEPLFSETDECLPQNVRPSSLHTICDFGKEK